MESLKTASRDGLQMTSGDGAIRHCYPIPACYVADYPEQCLVTCVRYGRACPTCKARWEDLELNKPAGDWEARIQRESLRTMKHATQLHSATRIENVLKPLGLNDIPEPFWRDLAHTNIHGLITPDILHQLYQGLVKHLVSWATNLIGATELDARFKRLPPTHGVRHFTSGISNLTMVSGNEHKDICKQLLGCLVGAKGVPIGAIRATRALLDFLYLAQYQSHSESTLAYLQTALDEFHKDKDVFLKMVARNSSSFESQLAFANYNNVLTYFNLDSGTHFRLPKLHALQHFINAIRSYGTTDNYNTEATERLHIDLAKDAYRATNKKEYLDQMVLWLERLEKLTAMELHIRWRLRDPELIPVTRVRRRQPPRIIMAKTPSAISVSMTTLTSEYGATQFESALKTFVAQHNDDQHRYTARRGDEKVNLRGLAAVDVWHRLKFEVPNLHVSHKPHTLDTAHVEPQRKGKDDHVLLARFDTVLINDSDAAEETGVTGMHRH